MRFTIDEQRSIERGDVVRMKPEELRTECVVLRADVYDQLRNTLNAMQSKPADVANQRPRSETPGQQSTSRFKPADRRWNLVGMAVGTTIGVLPALIPAPIGPILMWIVIGSAFGFFVPFFIFMHGAPADIDQKQFWRYCRIIGFIGCLGGTIAGVAGVPLPPETIGWTGTAGFFVGFAFVDKSLRRSDARRRQEELQWERPEGS
jgi:hypothetical protein